MDRPGDELLAAAALAFDQHRKGGPRRTRHCLAKRQRRRRRANQLAAGVVRDRRRHAIEDAPQGPGRRQRGQSQHEPGARKIDADASGPAAAEGAEDLAAESDRLDHLPGVQLQSRARPPAAAEHAFGDARVTLPRAADARDDARRVAAGDDLYRRRAQAFDDTRAQSLERGAVVRRDLRRVKKALQIFQRLVAAVVVRRSRRTSRRIARCNHLRPDCLRQAPSCRRCAKTLGSASPHRQRQLRRDAEQLRPDAQAGDREVRGGRRSQRTLQPLACPRPVAQRKLCGCHGAARDQAQASWTHPLCRRKGRGGRCDRGATVAKCCLRS